MHSRCSNCVFLLCCPYLFVLCPPLSMSILFLTWHSRTFAGLDTPRTLWLQFRLLSVCWTLAVRWAEEMVDSVQDFDLLGASEKHYGKHSNFSKLICESLSGTPDALWPGTILKKSYSPWNATVRLNIVQSALHSASAQTYSRLSALHKGEPKAPLKNMNSPYYTDSHHCYHWV